MPETFTPEQQNAIDEKIELLKGITNGSYSMGELNERITGKRLRWFEEHEDELRAIQEFGSLGLFVLIPYLYTGYMRINERDYDRFVWDDDDHGNIYLEIHSRNFCPYLEACRELKLDTNIICNNVLEKPVQSVISLVSPRSRFYRGNIRPYRDYCTEMVAVNPTSEEYVEFWRISHPNEYKALMELIHAEDTQGIST